MYVFDDDDDDDDDSVGGTQSMLPQESAAHYFPANGQMQQVYLHTTLSQSPQVGGT
jgi:hypothetical protein